MVKSTHARHIVNFAAASLVVGVVNRTRTLEFAADLSTRQPEWIDVMPDELSRGTWGLVAMTSACNAEGRQFDLGQV